MGSKSPQKVKPKLQDILIQLRMNSKRLSRESAKATKDSQAYMKKAKESLKKNNEDGAKLYLQSAASKRAQAINIQRMAMKMEFIAGHMKGMQNNAQIMGSFQQMTKLASFSNPNFETMSTNLTAFEKCMDDILINGKLMQEMMSQNMNTDATADNMLDALKGELAMETQNQVNQAALIKQRQMRMQENLKKV